MENKPQLKRKKNIIIVVIAVIIVFLVASVVDTFIGKKNVLKFIVYKTNISQCKLVIPSPTYIKGIKMTDFLGPYVEGCKYSWECFLMSETFSKESCYNKFAIEEKNSKLCNKIKTEFIKKSCIENVQK